MEAAKRAVDAGYDIVHVYAAHDIALPQHFLSPHTSHRTEGICLPQDFAG